MMENKHTIYFNMCHHYRKLFNAKPTIDTSPPKAYQIKSNNQWNYSRNPSPFRTKTPMQENVKTFQKEPYLTQDNGTVTCKHYYQHHNKKEASKNTEKSCNVASKPFNPRVLKTPAQSKLRNLRVYHPPRRKKVVKGAENSPSSPQKGEDKDEIIRRPEFADKSSLKSSKRQSIAVMDRNSYSEESSEDSAYNEGEGVLSSDSRGSTPQNLTNKHQSAKLTMVDNIQHKIINNSTNKVNDEIVYIQFLKDITHDILKKNIFTNKALKSVFQYHVQINKYELEMEKMQKEITKLQERLGVPKDDKLDDENYGLGKDPSISESLKPSKDSSRANSICIGDISETSSQSQDEEPPEDEDEDTSKEHDYSEDFSDFENHSIASKIINQEPSEDHNSYDTEENDEISSIVSDNEEIEEDEKNDENVAEEEDIISQGEDEAKSESDPESEISDIS